LLAIVAVGFIAAVVIAVWLALRTSGRDS
jgi:hypothetical protein